MPKEARGGGAQEQEAGGRESQEAPRRGARSAWKSILVPRSPSFLGHVVLTNSIKIKPRGSGDENEGRPDNNRSWKQYATSIFPVMHLVCPKNSA